MFKKVKNIKINYQQYGEGEDVVLLHGWGQNIEMMAPLGNLLKDDYRVTIVDLPGFGLSEKPDYAYTVYDYVDVLESLFVELKITKPNLVGHSFGGRLSIIYASKNDVSHLVLFGSPCVRHQSVNFKQKMFKSIKKVKFFAPICEYAKKFVGSVDYKNADGIMRDILVNTVNEDLSEAAKRIKCPTLLIWGDKDEAVPLEEAKELDNLLADSALITLSGSHYCYLENLAQVANILLNFF